MRIRKDYCNIPLQTEKSSKTCKFYFIVSYELEIYKDKNLHDCTRQDLKCQRIVEPGIIGGVGLIVTDRLSEHHPADRTA